MRYIEGRRSWQFGFGKPEKRFNHERLMTEEGGLHTEKLFKPEAV
jgi:hypothetical protein